MEHEDFVRGYRSGRVRVHVEREEAVKIAASDWLPTRYRVAHLFWSWAALLCLFGGPIALFWVEWWIAGGITAFGLVGRSAARYSACEFVLEHALEEPSFYDAVRGVGIIKVDEPAQGI